jgi:GT2 family glycosyltransferase
MKRRATVGVVIPTRDRIDELVETCLALQLLEPKPEEVIVCFDGEYPTEAKYLRTRFPWLEVIMLVSQRGAAFARQVCLEKSTTDLIVMLDDDSYPTQRDFIDRVIDLFDCDAKIGAAHFQEVRAETDSVRNLKEECYVRDFASCCAAIRSSMIRSGVKQVPEFQIQYEDTDLGLQIYSLGFAIRFAPDILIKHKYTDTGRDMRKRHSLHARNEQWSLWMRCPAPLVFVVAPYKVFSQLVYASSRGWGWAQKEPEWWWSALKGLRMCIQRRKPVGNRLFTAWLLLGRRPARSVVDLERLFGSCFGQSTLDAPKS